MIDDESLLIDKMLEKAKAYQLEQQVLELYNNYRSKGFSPEVSAYDALNNWEISKTMDGIQISAKLNLNTLTN